MLLSNIVKGASNYSRFFSLIPEFEEIKVQNEPDFDTQMQGLEQYKKEAELEFRNKAEEIIKKAENAARKLTEQAKKDCADMLAEAEKTAKKIYEENYIESYKKGFEEGKNKGYLEMIECEQKTIDELLMISKALDEEKTRMINRNKNLSIELAAEIAKKVIGQDINKEKAWLITVFERLVADLEPAEKLVVTVSGEDYKILSLEADRLKKIAKQFASVVIKQDNSAEEGTLILETAVMLIDASISTQINRLKKEIAGLEN